MVKLKDTINDKTTDGMNGLSEDKECNQHYHVCHNPSQISDNLGASSSQYNSDTSCEIPKSYGISTLGPSIYQEWPLHQTLWMSGPSSFGEKDPLDGFGGDDTESIMSFSSSTATTSSRRPHSHQLGTKVEMVYSLLSMLGSCNKEDMSRTLLEMSNNHDSCIAMRHSGCLPLLVQLLHGSDHEHILTEQNSEKMRWAVREARRRASQTLHNIVHAHPDDRRGRREARVLRLLEQIRDYSDYLRDLDMGLIDPSHNENLDMHPGPAIAALMKLSFDEEHRHAMCQLGGLQAIAELIQADHEVHGNTCDQFCVTVRRYAGMALTNLTFGDGTNKALLCSMKPFMQALVMQLHSPNEDLRQVTASVLRNLSWRADATSKQILREVGVVPTLTNAAMEATKESTLKSILSALWNLSAHCSDNKADICSISGALEFFVSTLTYKSTSKTLSIIENGGGILRNVSSHIAVREDYRAILRKHKCLQTLLCHLKSPSLTIVSNACGTLWNLSARCPEDQQTLWEMGAVGMLRNLVHSKHKMISMGSSAALKNLLAAKPAGMEFGLTPLLENGHQSNGGSPNMPSLLVRKQKALEADIDQNLSETCDNIDSPKTSPTPQTDAKIFAFETNGSECTQQRPQYLSFLPGRMYHSINGQIASPICVPRSESKDSLGSTRSEPPHYKAQKDRLRIFINNKSLTLDSQMVQEKFNVPPKKCNNLWQQLFKNLNNEINPYDTLYNESSYHSKNNELPTDSSGLSVSKRIEQNLEREKYCNISFDKNGTILDSKNISSLDSKGKVFENNIASPSNSAFFDQEETSFLNTPGNKRQFPKDKLNTKIPFYLNEIYKETPFNDTNPHIKNNLTQSDFTNSENNPFSPDINETLASKSGSQRGKKEMEIVNQVNLLKEHALEEITTDHTPPVISRCSSLSSLTSCFQPSARNSWVSDISQRTSAVISPTDMPDSPGCSTSENRPHLFEFTDKLPDAKMHGIIKPRPAWPSGTNPHINSESSPSKMLLDNCKLFHSLNDGIIVNNVQNEKMVESVNSIKESSTDLHKTSEKDLCMITQNINSCEIAEQSALNKDSFKCSPNNEKILTNTSDSQTNNGILPSAINHLSSSLTFLSNGISLKSTNDRLTQSATGISRNDANFPHLAYSTPNNNMHAINTCSEKFHFIKVETNTNNSLSICDKNDNVVLHSESVNLKDKQKNCLNFPDSSVKLKDSPSLEKTPSNCEAFASKCLNVCKKYPALVHKSSFSQIPQETKSLLYSNPNKDKAFSSEYQQKSSLEINSSCNLLEKSLHFSNKIKTAIPQIIRPYNPNFDDEVHPKQLQIMSQNLPVFKRNLLQHSQVSQAAEHSSSTDENISEPLSSSQSPCEGSEDNSDEIKHVQTNETTDEPQAKMSKSKSRKNKNNRRSVEIHVSSENSSEDDNKNIRETDQGSLSSISHAVSFHLSETEEKGKEDERTKEKSNFMLPRGAIPDLLEGAAFYNNKCGDSYNISSKNMSESFELRKGALIVATELEEVADECTHSSTSFDLENMKPPSCMGEMSMTSSGLSDLHSNGNGSYLAEKNSVLDRRKNLKRSKKINGNRRFILKSVKQVLTNNLELSKAKDNCDKIKSNSGSNENLSMKSSGTSDLIENINPPSLLDDISMTNSCTSLNSISSDILESRSQSLADNPSNSEMFQRLNAAAAMVQVYSRELNNIMSGSMKSSYNSDCLDLVKPPSIFQDIAEVTIEDGTEVASDLLISDSELEEELPHDDEVSMPSSLTVHSPYVLSANKTIDGSTENSLFNGECTSFKEQLHHPKPTISLANKHESQDYDVSTNGLQHSSSNLSCPHSSRLESTFNTELEGLQIAQITSYEKHQAPSIHRGPRIVKPINRETVRQMQEKKNAEKNMKSLPKKSQFNKPRNLLQQVTSIKYNSVVNKAPSTGMNSVRPTKTSALRASQNKQNGIKNHGRTSPRSVLSKPPSLRNSIKMTKVTKVNNLVYETKNKQQDEMSKRPGPPVKQGTFTKEDLEKPTISSSDFKLPPKQLTLSDGQNNNDLYSQKIHSPMSGVTKIFTRKFSNASFNNASSSSVFSNERKLSAPLSRRNENNPNLSSSPSFQSLSSQEKSGLSSEIQNPNNAIIGHNTSVTSRTASSNSLSSLSSSGISIRKLNFTKEVPSKISHIWKSNETGNFAYSPVVNNSNSEKNSLSESKSKSTVKTLSNRVNCVPSTMAHKQPIPRSSTYEKMPKTIAKGFGKAPKEVESNEKTPSARNALKTKLQTSSHSRSGGARIVKPVIPQAKSNAVTSRTLRQASTSSFGPKLSSRITEDSKASIPLVTAPFAYSSSVEANLILLSSNDTEIGNNSQNIHFINGEKTSSENEDSDLENNIKHE